MQCKAETKNGTRCKLAADVTDYCRLHEVRRVRDYREDTEEDWGLREGETLVGEMHEGTWTI